MRTRTLIVTAAVVGALGTVTGIVAAQAGSPAPASRTQFTVVEHAVTDTTGDVDPHGDSLGDILAFRNPVFNAQNTRRVGTDNGSCIRTEVGAAYECSWTVVLKNGSLVVSGPFYDAVDSTLAVTGGTGVYSDARGSMLLHARDAAGSEYDFAFMLVN